MIFCSVVSVSSFDLYSPFSIISCTDTMTNNQWLFVLFTVHAKILLLPVSLLSLRFYETKACVLCFGDVSTLRGFFPALSCKINLAPLKGGSEQGGGEAGG